MRRRKHKEDQLKRTNKKEILFNNLELEAINTYCERFKVKNKSKFMREAIITEVLKKFDDNYPTLWNDGQMTIF
jgi:hypothetical protein